MVTKKEIADAVSRLIEYELAPRADDSQLEFVLCLAKQSLADNPDMIDPFLENPIVASVVHEEQGGYDVGNMISVLKSVLGEYESYPIEIPRIPLLLPKDKTIHITVDDIARLECYLNGEESVEEEEIPSETTPAIVTV